MGFLKFLDQAGAVCTYIRNFFFNILFFIFLFLGVISFFCFLGILTLMADNGHTSASNVKNPKSPVLSVVINSPVMDAPPVESVSHFLLNALKNNSPREYFYLQDFRKAIARAADDKKIKAVVIRLGDEASLRLDQAKVMGSDLKKFQEKGKKVYIYSEAYDRNTYALASYVKENVYAHPLGGIFLMGYQLKSLYFKELLDNAMITVFTPKAGAYKSAIEPFNQNEMSPHVKAEYQGIADDLWDQYKKLISENRPGAAIQNFVFGSQNYLEIMKKSQGDSAMAAASGHLVDKLTDYDTFMEDVAKAESISLKTDKESYRRRLETLTFRDYLRISSDSNPQKSKNKIAVIFGSGEITSTSEYYWDFTSENLVPQINKAIEDSSVKALVLYLDTPGGDVFASDLIRSRVEAFRKSGRKVVIYMSGMTASGGYMISTASDYIVAEPTAITGSIGVFAMAGNFSKLANFAGVHVDGAGSEGSQSLSVLEPFPETYKAMAQLEIDHTYEMFLKMVAGTRNMSVDKVRPLAEGRIYTGTQAIKIGLVDKLGGFDDAVAEAAKLAKIDNSYQVVFSKPIVSDDISDLGIGIIKAVSLVNEPLALKILNSYLPAPKNLVPQENGKPRTVSFIPFTVQ
ncbi:signal peptide peptidase SppA [Succinimonas sp.]|uniref:signal peptide peptidase SppA n=1 Tax=Succinimonas sp. TaxID=1936151 RepID=UPI0038701186